MPCYQFGPFALDVQERRLLRGGEPVPLTPKVFDTLVHLVERHGRLVGKDELLEAVWAGSYVEEGSVARTIHVLRKALSGGGAGDGQPSQYIETIPKAGYRFAAEVTRVAEATSSEDEPSAQRGLRSHTPAAPSSVPWRGPTLLTATALVVLALAGSASRATIEPEPQRPQTASGEAFAKFQSGRLRLSRHLPGDIDGAIADFEKAIELDPSFAAAHAGKADASFFRYSDTGSHDDIVQARLGIQTALALDDGSAYAHALQCRFLGTYDWDLADAEAECRRALSLDRTDSEVRRERAFLLNALGRRSEALKEMDAVVATAPTSFNKRSRGVLLYFARRFDEAIAQLEQVEATDPEYAGASRWIARCREQKRDYEAALEAFVRSRATEGATAEEITVLRRAFQDAGWPGLLRAALSRSASVPPDLETAGTYAQLGEPDAAFAALEAMVAARRLMIVHMDNEPRLDPIRHDPRFEPLARRVGLRKSF